MVIVAALVSHASRLRHCDLVGEKLCIRISAREHLMTFTIPTCTPLVPLGWSLSALGLQHAISASVAFLTTSYFHGELPPQGQYLQDVRKPNSSYRCRPLTV